MDIPKARVWRVPDNPDDWPHEPWRYHVPGPDCALPGGKTYSHAAAMWAVSQQIRVLAPLWRAHLGQQEASA